MVTVRNRSARRMGKFRPEPIWCRRRIREQIAGFDKLLRILRRMCATGRQQ